MKLGLPYVPLRGVRGGRNVRKKAASVIAIAGAFVSLHIYSAPLGVVVGCATWRRLEGRLAAVEGLSIQDPASELRGIPLPRTCVNKKLVPRCEFVRDTGRQGSGHFATVVMGKIRHLTVSGVYSSQRERSKVHLPWVEREKGVTYEPT
jgi:hypothetical protein